MSKALELSGKIFGNLTVIRKANQEEYGEHYKNDFGTIRWVVQCKCGTKKVYPGSRIKSGKLKSCGCLNGNKKPDGEAAKWNHYTWYRAIAKRRKKTFLLTLQEFLRITSSPCHYCGTLWSMDFCNRRRSNGMKKYRGNYRHNGIDRVDSNIGYVSENCVPCCKACNVAKAEMTKDEFVTWIRKVYNHSVIKYDNMEQAKNGQAFKGDLTKI